MEQLHLFHNLIVTVISGGLGLSVWLYSNYWLTLLFLCILHAPVDDQADQPTLLECIRFRGRKRRINIPQEIGVKYREFGLLLLEDHNGAKIRALVHKHTNDVNEINIEIIEEWVTGRGKHPVTWKTLIQVLRDIELSTLAGEIEAIKN